MSKKRFAMRVFTVVSRRDHDNMNINCNHYSAIMYNDYSIEVNNVLYSNDDFYKLYTINVI